MTTRWTLSVAEPRVDGDERLYDGMITDPNGAWVHWDDIAELKETAETVKKLIDQCNRDFALATEWQATAEGYRVEAETQRTRAEKAERLFALAEADVRRYADTNLQIKADDHALRAELIAANKACDLASVTLHADGASRAELDLVAADGLLDKIGVWSDTYGYALVPRSPYHDTFGDGVRFCKSQMKSILAAHPAAPVAHQPNCESLRAEMELRTEAEAAANTLIQQLRTNLVACDNAGRLMQEDRDRLRAEVERLQAHDKGLRIQIESLRAEVERLQALHGREASERMAAESHLRDATDLVRWILRESTIQGLLRRELEAFLAAQPVAPAPEQTCDAMREANELRLDRERRPASDDQASPIKRLARISQIDSLREEVADLRAQLKDGDDADASMRDPVQSLRATCSDRAHAMAQLRVERDAAESSLAAATELARDIVMNYPDHTLAIAARALLAAQPAAPDRTITAEPRCAQPSEHHESCDCESKPEAGGALAWDSSREPKRPAVPIRYGIFSVQHGGRSQNYPNEYTNEAAAEADIGRGLSGESARLHRECWQIRPLTLDTVKQDRKTYRERALRAESRLEEIDQAINGHREDISTIPQKWKGKPGLPERDVLARSAAEYAQIIADLEYRSKVEQDVLDAMSAVPETWLRWFCKSAGCWNVEEFKAVGDAELVRRQVDKK